MPDLFRGDLDVYALLDADTDEARTFTTYHGYWLALAAHVEREYGEPPFPALLGQLEARGLRRLGGRPCSGDESLLRSALLNAWSTELSLHLVDIDDTGRLWLSNQWAQVQSYYATSRAASAWLVARDGQAPKTHAGLLQAVAAQVAGSRLYPCPWSLGSRDLGCPLLRDLGAVGARCSAPDQVPPPSSGLDAHGNRLSGRGVIRTR